MDKGLRDALMIIGNGCSSREQNQVFNNLVKPFFDSVINSVFFTLNFFPHEMAIDEYDDLKQEIYFMLLTRLNGVKRLERIKDLEAYTFISVRNKTLNYFRTTRKRDALNKFCQDTAARVNSDDFSVNTDISAF